MILAFHKEKTWQVGIWQVEETISELLKMLPEKAYYEEQIQSFNSSVRRREWLASRVLLKTLCGEHKEIAYTASHRPYLVDGSY
ncbi:MAG: siderophore biosynthesis protein, partial [Bacteroidaceae bacterium]